jgi:hypothetical protein
MQMRSARARRWALPAVSTLLAVVISFLVGVRTANENELVDLASAEGLVSVIVTLQYLPVGSEIPIPLKFLNVSATKPVILQEIHDGTVLPARSVDGCQRTNDAGRCSIGNIVVGSGEDGRAVERQYDIFLADATLFEALTNIPFERPLPFLRFDPSLCDDDNVFVDTGDVGWCLSQKSSGGYYNEYFVTLTLKERDVCRDAPPPSLSCTPDGKVINYACDPQYRGATMPWRPLPPATCEGDYVRCPNGTAVPALCVDLDGITACSQVEACKDHQLCEVFSFPTPPPVIAGHDEIVIKGRHFGNKGGAVSFARSDPEGKAVQDEREIVLIPPGPNWTDTEIRVMVPYTAGEGSLRIIPEGYPVQGVDINRNQPLSVGGQVDAATILWVPKAFAQFGTRPASGIFGGMRQATIAKSKSKKSEGTYVGCEAPTLYVTRPEDQPTVVSARIISPPNGTVEPGFTTVIEAIAYHAKGIDNLYALDVELLEGTFSDVADVPFNRPTLARVQCDLRKQYPPVKSVVDSTFQCGLPIPENLPSDGPFTFLVRVSGGIYADDPLITGRDPSQVHRVTDRMAAVIPVAGKAALAGDFNANGLHDVEDAAIASRIVRGRVRATAEHLLRDVDGDRKITRADLIAVLHILAQ